MAPHVRARNPYGGNAQVGRQKRRPLPLLERGPSRIRPDEFTALGTSEQDPVVGRVQAPEAHAGASDELDGGVELRLVFPCIGELGTEVLSNKVRDTLPEDAGHQVGSSLPRHGLPEVSVCPDVLKDREHGLEELGLPSRPLLGRVPLGGQSRADVLEPGAEEIVFVAVVRVEGRHHRRHDHQRRRPNPAASARRLGDRAAMDRRRLHRGLRRAAAHHGGPR